MASRDIVLPRAVEGMTKNCGKSRTRARSPGGVTTKNWAGGEMPDLSGGAARCREVSEAFLKRPGRRAYQGEVEGARGGVARVAAKEERLLRRALPAQVRH